MIVKYSVLGYFIGEGFSNVFKNKKSTGASLMIMCATMIIFGIFLILGENINHIVKEGNRFYYVIGGRKIEFLTVHKSKGLEADYVILLQCNKDTYGFPSLVSDDPVLNYVLTKSDQFPYGEERRLFYVAITRAKLKTLVLYDKRFPSVFVDEFLHPEKVSEESYVKHPNANKRWTRRADQFLLELHNEGKSVKYIAAKMGRSQTSIVMRLNKLTQ